MKMFDAGKTKMIGLPYGEKTIKYVKPFSSDTGTLRTDRQTDRIAISISRVSMLTRDKKSSQSDHGNYRPVSLTSIVCKLMESIIRCSVTTHFKLNHLFSNKPFDYIATVAYSR